MIAVNSARKKFSKKYPTGRKLCPRCTWRPVTDFGVRKWADKPYCSVPQSLSSHCRTCEARARRQKNGYKPRNWYHHGTPDSVRYKEHRRNCNRNTSQKRFKDPSYRKDKNEYNRIWYNGRNGVVSQAYNVADLGEDIQVARAPLNDFLDKLNAPIAELVRRTGMKETLLSGSHDAQTISLSKADTILTRLGYPELVAVFWPLPDTVNVRD